MIITEIFPICDFCHNPCHDMHTDKKSKLLRDMKANGWRRVSGKDMCCTCCAGGTSWKSPNELRRGRD